MKEEKINELKEFLETFTKVCYSVGKMEGLKGDKEDHSAEICVLPKEILSELVTQITNEKIEPSAPFGFNTKEIIIPKLEKIVITAEKEQKLIDKFGLKEMEKLARQMKYRGKILNKQK